MDIKQYFLDEMNFLRRQGEEFVKIHPKLASFLSEKSSDPDVERLLEGFAFLTARLRQKIDDEFPELTHSIINLLWPHYLRSIPSICMMRFYPRDDSITEQQLIQKGTRVRNLEEAEFPVEFRTTRDLKVYPLVVTGIQDKHTREESQIKLSFECFSNLLVRDINLDVLDLYFGDSYAQASDLYLWFNCYLSSIYIEYIVNGELRRKQINIDDLVPGGFDVADSILPYQDNSFHGYRVLQEFFVFPEKYLFIKLVNLDRYFSTMEVSQFDITFCFGRVLSDDFRLNEKSIQLYCCPAVNLFKMSGDPIVNKGQRNDYLVSPNAQRQDTYAVYSVDKVEGWLLSSDGRARMDSTVEYHAFESFRHTIENINNRQIIYYKIKIVQSLNKKKIDHKIAFVHENGEAYFAGSDVVSLDLTCSNGDLAKDLQVGDISSPADDTPTYVRFQNITRPTDPIQPILDGSLYWKLISNLSLNYVSLLERDSLITILSVYDFPSQFNRQAELTSRRRYEGIKTLKSTPTDIIFKGLPVRGIKSQIVMDDSFFISEGDMYLFASVLAEFLSLYASINSFHILTVVNEVSDESWNWSMGDRKGREDKTVWRMKFKKGQQPII